MKAGVFSARGIAELNMIVISLGDQGYRIITVLTPLDGYYEVVAQQEASAALTTEPLGHGVTADDFGGEA